MELTANLYNGQGFVKIIDVIPSEIPKGFKSRDAVIVNIAKISTNTKPIKDDFKVYDFIEKLFKMQHFSPFEQAILTFRIKVPYVVWSQVDRHRTFVYSSQLRRSGRYTKFSEEDFYIPKYLDNYNISDGLPMTAKDFLSETITLSTHNYEMLLEAGVSKESARFVLPAFCILYEDVVNVNLKNLFHFFSLRRNIKVQPEIRELAENMMEITKVLFPYSIKIYNENPSPINYNFDEL